MTPARERLIESIEFEAEFQALEFEGLLQEIEAEAVATERARLRAAVDTRLGLLYDELLGIPIAGIDERGKVSLRHPESVVDDVLGAFIRGRSSVLALLDEQQ